VLAAILDLTGVRPMARGLWHRIRAQ
jgi:hypothetical protein